MEEDLSFVPAMTGTLLLPLWPGPSAPKEQAPTLPHHLATDYGNWANPRCSGGVALVLQKFPC